MSCKHTSKAPSTRWAWVAAAFVLGAGAGCDSYSTFRGLSTACGEDSAYELQVINSFDTVGESAFWVGADPTPNSVATGTVEKIPDGARCGSNVSAVLRASGNNDWGGMLGYNNFGPRNASTFDGVSFWAKTRGNTSPTIILQFSDLNTEPDVAGSLCIAAATTAGGQTQTVIDPGTGTAITSTATTIVKPNECGNLYSAYVVVSSDWHYYTVPWIQFQQDIKPNRVPNALLTKTGNVPGTGLLTESLLVFNIRFPKEAPVEIWLDDLAFYKEKATNAP